MHDANPKFKVENKSGRLQIARTNVSNSLLFFNFQLHFCLDFLRKCPSFFFKFGDHRLHFKNIFGVYIQILNSWMNIFGTIGCTLQICSGCGAQSIAVEEILKVANYSSIFENLPLNCQVLNCKFLWICHCESFLYRDFCN